MPSSNPAFAKDFDTPAHEHVFLGRAHDQNARRTLMVVVITAVMMVAEIVAGYAFNSMALLADGFHMATHAGALGIAAIAYAFAKSHARDRGFTFGTGKVGDLAGFASALVLAIVAIGIGVESVVRLFQPGPVAFGEAALIAAIGLAVNLLSALLLSGGHHDAYHAHDHGHGHGEHGAHEHHDHHHHQAHRDHAHHGEGRDNNLRSALVHVLADALTSVLAIAALLAGSYLGLVWLDPAMGIVGAAVIATWSWSLLRDTGSVLLDRTDPAIEAEIRAAVLAPGDAEILDLHVWRVGPAAHAAIVSVAGTVDGDAIRERLKSVHEVAHLTVETRRPGRIEA